MSKLNNLVEWFTDKNKVMIALSGGVDSAVVAYAAFQALGNSAIAVTADYKTLSQEELLSAKQVCSEIGIEQIILDYSELENENFVKNVNGITISPKKSFCILKVWMAGTDKQNPKSIIDIDGLNSHGCLFKKHNPEY